MLRRYIACVIACALLPTRVHAAELDALAKKLARGAATLENKKIAVLSFPYHDEKISSASTLLSERLTTCLAQQKSVRVLERHLIDELIRERKLSETGVIDPSTLKALGTMLDADAVVCGTLIDLPNGQTEINARLIRIDTGEVLSAGRAVVVRTWTDAPAAIKLTPHMPAMAIAPSANSPLPQNEPIGPATPDRRSLSGQSLKLSNENFPPDHRRYLANEPPAHVAKKFAPASTIGFLGLPDVADSYGSGENGNVPNPVMPVRPGHSGYNGTDDKPLPFPFSVYNRARPPGTVRYDRRTYRPAATKSLSK